jgi:hypothetical protein
MPLNVEELLPNAWARWWRIFGLDGPKLCFPLISGCTEPALPDRALVGRDIYLYQIIKRC